MSGVPASILDDFRASLSRDDPTSEDEEGEPEPEFFPSVSSTNKRPRDALDDTEADDNEELASNEAQGPIEGEHDTDTHRSTENTAPQPNKNLVEYARRFGARKRLCTERQKQLEQFAQDPPAVQNVKLYAEMLKISEKQDEQIEVQPPWEPSKNLTMNIKKWAAAVLLSPKLAYYKGGTRNIVANILKKKRYDLPDNIEEDSGLWHKVEVLIDRTLTDIRRVYKDMLGASLAGTPAEHWDIYKLTKALCELYPDAKCQVSVPLCARVAFLRKMYVAINDTSYWTVTDKALKYMRDERKGNQKMINEYFREKLKEDREVHGHYDPAEAATVPSKVSTRQAEVDDLVLNINV